MVNQSHSWGTVAAAEPEDKSPPVDESALVDMPPPSIPGVIMDRVDADMPNELDVNPANDADVAVVPNPLGLVAASFEPVEFSGLSTSIASL